MTTQVIEKAILLGQVGLLSAAAFAADEAVLTKSTSIARTDSPPVIDGVLDDAAWGAVPDGGFDRGTRIDDLYFCTLANYEEGLPVQRLKSLRGDPEELAAPERLLIYTGNFMIAVGNVEEAQNAARGMADWARHDLRVHSLQEYHEGLSGDQLVLPL